MLFGETRQLQADIKNKFDYNDDLKKCIVTINCTVKESVPAQNNKGLSIVSSLFISHLFISFVDAYNFSFFKISFEFSD